MAKKRRNGGYSGGQDYGDDEAIMGFSSVYLWVDPTVSAPVFGLVLVALISICYYSLLSVIAYSALCVLGIAVGVRGYVYVMRNILKKEVDNPLTKVEEMDLTISEEQVNEIVQKVTSTINTVVGELSSLFLAKEIVDTVKLAVILWVLTYVGGWFNAMTLIILSWVALFTVPKVYVNNRQTLDPILDKVKAQLGDVVSKASAVLPARKSASVSEEKKED